jgi:hypothetical protein
MMIAICQGPLTSAALRSSPSATRRAKASGSIKKGIGNLLGAVIGVRMKPGCTVVTGMPLATSSMRSDSQSVVTADLLAL